jgi:cytidylate kinase
MSPLIIAIDGFSSCGKSTFAKAIAQKLGYAYIRNPETGENETYLNGICVERDIRTIAVLEMDETPRTSGRYTFITHRHFTKDSLLLESGLLGPVTIWEVKN